MRYRLFFMVLCGILAFAGRASAEPVRLGIDVLVGQNFQPLAGKRVGLVAHPASVDSQLRHTADVLREAPGVQLVALFGPEHGVFGDVPAGEYVASATDPRTGLPLHSLYGKTRRPSKAQLGGIDVLVVDLQDIGVRSYTFVSTMVECLHASAEAGIPLVVLDRPNPLGGVRIEGPMLEESFRSFVGPLVVPYVHGMTIGELAQLARDRLRPDYKQLTVVKMSGWNRNMTWNDTGLAWVPTSPHIPTVSSCFGYLATGVLGELGVASNGVGYTLPFEVVGQENLDGHRLAERLERYFGPGAKSGLTFRPCAFRPYYGSSRGKTLGGVQLHVRPDASAKLVEVNFMLIEYLGGGELLNQAKDRWDMFDKICGTASVREHLLRGENLWPMFAAWREQSRAFEAVRGKWLLYP